MQLRAVLFDLDGTLLQNDMDVFTTHFLRRLTPHLLHRVMPEHVVKSWQAALHIMANNTDPNLTNQQVFDLSFYPRIGVLREELEPLLDTFYTTSYPELSSLVRPQPGARETVEAMLDAELDVVVATNPIFPMTAVAQRLEWVDLMDLDFKLITSSENMHATKPNVEYYREIADLIEHKPSECLMIGDDYINDIRPATRLGMHTYWVNTTTTTPPNFDPKSRGQLHHFYTWLVQLGLLKEQT